RARKSRGFRSATQFFHESGKRLLTAPRVPPISPRLGGATHRAQVAELVDALASGASGLTAVEVRVLSWAPFLKRRCIRPDAAPFVISALPFPFDGRDSKGRACVLAIARGSSMLRPERLTSLRA